MAIKVDIQKKIGNFSLNVQFETEKRRIGILGASGAGKSMTLRGIAGIERLDRGSIRLDDTVLYDRARGIDRKPQSRNIGYLFQNYALFPTMSVAENIMIGVRGSREEKLQRMQAMVEKFRLSGLENRLPGQLSGGQQQRVALARIMAYQPWAILLDEPFAALDIYLKDHMQEELKKLLEDYSGTVIMVSHDRDEIYRFAQELLVMDQGRVVTAGSCREVFAHPDTIAAARLTGCKNISRAEYLDPHSFRALDWGVTLQVAGELPPADSFRAVGFRAHGFRPVWGEAEANCIPFRLFSVSELPFERNYYIQAGGEEDSFLSWFVQKEDWKLLDQRGNPDYLRFEEAGLMYLRA